MRGIFQLVSCDPIRFMDEGFVPVFSKYEWVEQWMVTKKIIGISLERLLHRALKIHADILRL